MSLMLSTARPVPALAGAVSTLKQLCVEISEQRADQWCWCAVTLGLLNYYVPGSGGTQCELAAKILGFPWKSEQLPCPPGMNKPYELDDALSKYGMLEGQMIEGALSFEKIVAQIDIKRPIGALTSSLGFNHVVVIRGYRADDEERILIADPAKGEDEMSLVEFRDSYQTFGKWEFSYLTRPPPGQRDWPLCK